MKPVFCEVSHQPPFSYGDCLRCCIASILEVTTESIPHPFSHDPDSWDSRYEDMLNYLRIKHKAHLYLFRIAKEHLNDFILELRGYAILCGVTDNGTPHAVVVNKSGVIHDPIKPDYPLNASIDGSFSLMFLCHGVETEV